MSSALCVLSHVPSVSPATPAPAPCDVTLGREHPARPASISFHVPATSEDLGRRGAATPSTEQGALAQHTFIHVCSYLYEDLLLPCSAGRVVMTEGVDRKRMELPQNVIMNSFLGVLKIFLRGKRKSMADGF